MARSDAGFAALESGVAEQGNRLTRERTFLLAASQGVGGFALSTYDACVFGGKTV